MSKLKCVGVEFYGYNHVNGAATSTKKKETLFPALKSLTIESCPALITWEELPTDEKVAVFPCLEELIIKYCSRLKFIPITMGKGKGKGMPCLRKLLAD
ncbi:disease resistance protein RGA2 isoform X4 [Prunus yedoensis var. nudiflora]|uniref:Disease resistance protein RGA2 isoform X4 n=1 Tax=Prunus yedoensis var. nudiflora TaxID=2094558 RepID=A0A314YSN7_PRUYE|nr:disease resistance protein RGA2 isoform X4 [Prunus yedoensis var. nudiflora]